MSPTPHGSAERRSVATVEGRSPDAVEPTDPPGLGDLINSVPDASIVDAANSGASTGRTHPHRSSGRLGSNGRPNSKLSRPRSRTYTWIIGGLLSLLAASAATWFVADHRRRQLMGVESVAPIKAEILRLQISNAAIRFQNHLIVRQLRSVGVANHDVDSRQTDQFDSAAPQQELQFILHRRRPHADSLEASQDVQLSESFEFDRVLTLRQLERQFAGVDDRFIGAVIAGQPADIATVTRADLASPSTTVLLIHRGVGRPVLPNRDGRRHIGMIHLGSIDTVSSTRSTFSGAMHGCYRIDDRWVTADAAAVGGQVGYVGVADAMNTEIGLSIPESSAWPIGVFPAMALAIGLTLTATFDRLHRRRTGSFKTNVSVDRDVPRQLGDYRIETLIGRGGMGHVYRARHHSLGRPAAVKLLTGHIGVAAVSRFRREVRSTASLRHPNTIAVLDHGETDTGVFYYVMEYIDGLSLEELVGRHGPLPPGRVIHLVRQICGSIAEAHSLGLIHRDIKPANVLVCHGAGIDDLVKVVDFGLVKRVDHDSGETRSTMLTVNDSITGTPMYMSPEAVRDAHSPNTQSDLYSIAALAYFLLTGETLFEPGSTMEVCLRQLNDDPIPPSRRVPFTVPNDLERIIMVGLAKKPSARWLSVDEFADALAQCRDAKTWTPADRTRWWARVSAHGGAGDGQASGVDRDGDPHAAHATSVRTPVD